VPRPTFLIAGGMKCGTTSLHSTLRQHPQIFMTRPKELHFFDRNYGQGWDWYESHFRPGPSHLAWGESSPAYMYFGFSRRRIAQSLPDVKIVVLLRDPVKRAYSQYWMYREKGLEPAATFDEGLRLERQRLKGSLTSQVRYSYMDRGRYIDQIEAFESAIGRDRIHVLLLEDLTGDTESALRPLLGFLGVDPQQASTMSMRHTNYSGHLAARQAQRAEPDDEDDEAADFVREPMSEEARQLLSEHFRPYNQRLERWTGRDLSHWT